MCRSLIHFDMILEELSVAPVCCPDLFYICAFVQHIEVRDYPHGMLGFCTRYPRGLATWAELLGRRPRFCRRQLVSSGGSTLLI